MTSILFSSYLQGFSKPSPTLDPSGPLQAARAKLHIVLSTKKMIDADVRRIFEVNLIGTFNSYTLAAKQMIAQGPVDAEGSHQWTYKIIGASSIVAFQPYPLASYYSVVKSAIRVFTNTFAMEMAKHKIAVNAYAPGVIDTTMWDEIDDELAEVQRALMGRLGTPDDVAMVVSFLAGPDSAFVNGQTLVVDGGIVMT
ncbi:short chain type dehydrogenase, putative [Talaromyces stipitatus ATCC 10500]|uniref:Short chain type dehydrogenase, putative n=1 Tax=Talaromyces stipitatus (strain ATCC 10500 / CBS 375.48 / QM 6759 / NRRL 1006) TaxID=441959 RepID=B8LZ14_TALSN|nr:short chain type dehydrogenase, putative [Talaromyces stipitatus ATCC 10500]EED21058.1 short chain type dehydrogenase, putative [Talaromyces stipitatus ATCC 10500]